MLENYQHVQKLEPRGHYAVWLGNGSGQLYNFLRPHTTAGQ